jgi:hypothetical protein
MTCLNKLNNKGVTIVELLIYLGLSTIMLVVLSELFVSILDESVKTQNYSAVQTDGRYILGRLKTQLNNATAVVTPANLGETSYELVLIISGATHRYYIINTKLYLSDGTGDYLISHLDTRITGVVFTRTGNIGGKPVILIEFVSSTGASGTIGYESQTFKGAGGLR